MGFLEVEQGHLQHLQNSQHTLHKRALAETSDIQLMGILKNGQPLHIMVRQVTI